MKHCKRFLSHDDYIDALNNNGLTRHSLSFCKDESDVHYDVTPDYFYTIALSDGIIKLNTPSVMHSYIDYVSYSTDNNKTWITIEQEDLSGSITVNVAAGDKVLWKCGINTFSNKGVKRIYFYSPSNNNCNFNIGGNIMSLCYGDNFGNKRLTESYQFAHAFSSGNIVSAKDLKLPDNTINGCYYGMFQNGTSLIETPVLPAMTLSPSCYYSMFQNCTSLVNAPELPAQTLTSWCYDYMFANCASLNYIKMLCTTDIEHGITPYTIPYNEDGTGRLILKNPNVYDLFTFDVTEYGWTVEYLEQ